MTLRGLATISLWCFGLTFWVQSPRITIGADSPGQFLKRHCVECHGQESPEASLSLHGVNDYREDDRHLWTMIHEEVASGRMPPAEVDAPDQQEVKKLLEWIESRQRDANPSRLRRLNRRELSSALQDLTGVRADFASGLPGDGLVDGFDTGAAALQDSANSLMQMMNVTRQATGSLRFLEEADPAVVDLDLRTVKDPRQAINDLKKAGLSVSTSNAVSRAGIGLWIKPKWLGERGGLSIHAPVPDSKTGVFRVSVVVSGEKRHSNLPNPHLWVTVGNYQSGIVEVTAGPEDEPQRIIFDVLHTDLAAGKKGIEVEIANRIEVPYSVQGFENDAKGASNDEEKRKAPLFRPLFDRKSDPETHPVPWVVLHELRIEPTFTTRWPAEQKRRTLQPITDHDASASALLTLWLEQAWRRPATDTEFDRYFKLYRSLREEDLSFDASLRATFQATLLSSPFRYLQTPASDTSGTHYQLASRLSFMLWGRLPDENLRALAARGRLRDPNVLESEIRRLLADPRSDQFWTSFVTQWLELEQPVTLAMKSLEHQDFRFGRHLKDSMKRETIEYVRRLVLENRPARELVDSRWTMMNNVLAWHYGYEGVTGGELRPVTLRKSDPRQGGLLSHGGIQSMLCWMGENWVIYRGVWVLRNILDDPPPPPPLDVPELIPSDREHQGKSLREILKSHQSDSRCSVCHRSIDPLGFAFQNFDLSGRWRDDLYEQYATRELDGKIEWNGKGKATAVDASGSLPNGEEFTTFQECKSLIVRNYQPVVVQGLMKKLVLYGTGRRADVDDLAEIRRLMADAETDDYRLGDLVTELIKSRVFTAR